MKKNRVYAGIDLDALRYNMESMHKNIKEGTKIAAVIKADAYGHGALTVAKTIEDLPYVWGFAVATADEAEMLIADGRKKPILILGISFPEHYELIVEKEIRPAICEYEAAKALSDIAVRKNKTCHIHIKIDTGMSRIGLQVTEDSADLIAGIAKLPNIEIEGIFTHFAQADEYDKTPTQKQIALFQKMITMLEERNVKNTDPSLLQQCRNCRDPGSKYGYGKSRNHSLWYVAIGGSGTQYFPSSGDVLKEPYRFCQDTGKRA